MADDWKKNYIDIRKMKINWSMKWKKSSNEFFAISNNPTKESNLALVLIKMLLFQEAENISI